MWELTFAKRLWGTCTCSRSSRSWSAHSASPKRTSASTLVPFHSKGLNSCYSSQHPHKFVNLSFTITVIKNKLTDLCENWLLQCVFGNTWCEIRSPSRPLSETSCTCSRSSRSWSARLAWPKRMSASTLVLSHTKCFWSRFALVHSIVHSLTYL